MTSFMFMAMLFAAGHDELLANPAIVPLRNFSIFTQASGWKENIGDWKYGPELSACVNPPTRPSSWVWTSNCIETQQAISIRLLTVYSARDCAIFSSDVHCKHGFDVYIHQSTKYSTAPDASANSELYIKVGTYNATTKWAGPPTVQHKNTDTLTFALQNLKPCLYIAFRYTGGCLAVSKVEVSYFRCSTAILPRTLVKLQETMAPANGSVRVNGTCAPFSSVVHGAGHLHGYCQSDGEWSRDRFGGECQCEAGRQNTSTTGANKAECKVCPNGTYKYTARKGDCIGCPGNSSTAKDGRSCDCSVGFYRADDENITIACTAPPSAPKNLRTTFINATLMALMWSVPDNSGGRTDLFYQVKSLRCNASYQGCISVRTMETMTVTASLDTLNPFTHYQIRVYARNGVSGKAEDDPRNKISAKFVEIDLRTHESTPGMPKITAQRKSDAEVVVQWELRDPNGVIISYEIVYYPTRDPSDKKRIITSGNTTQVVIPVKAGVEYEFKVRASTQQGFGPFSETKAVTTSPPGAAMSTVISATAGGLGGLLLLLFIIIAVLWITKRRRRQMKKRETESQRAFEMDGIVHLPTSGQRMYIDPSNYGDPMQALLSVATEIDKDEITLEKMIGGGEFADVYKGMLTLNAKKETVAVKILKTGSTHKNREDFCIEASIMGQFDHPNVIQLKGVVTKTKPMMIVTEFMENGSLDNFLKTNDGNLTILQLVGIARGVAAGMTYLSEMNFIHRDLAARNILVADNLSSKVSDFGLSRELDDTPDNPDSEYQTQGGKIPVRWTAPEAIRYKKFSSASDVWSYGILLWEIMSFAERPYWNWDNWQVMDRVESGYRLPAPMNCPKVIHNLMLDCWDKDKVSRPKFADMVRRLDELIRSPDKMKNEQTGSHSLSRADATNFAMLNSVEEWLDDINMSRYTGEFTNNGYVKLNHVCHLEERDLERIGVKLIGHRNKISKSIKAMNKQLESGELAV